MCHIAGCYFYGEEGLPHDEKKAVGYFSKAAKRGHPVAACCLALAYLDGKGVTQNKATAAEYFKQAAALGDPNAHCCLGKMYLRGEGLPRSCDLAVKHFTEAERLGEATATRYLSQIKSDIANGTTPGLPANPREAVELLHQMAEVRPKPPRQLGLTPGGRGQPPAPTSTSPSGKTKKWVPKEKWDGRQSSGADMFDPGHVRIDEVTHRRHLPPSMHMPKKPPRGMRFNTF